MDSTLHYTSVSHADSVMGAINKMRLNSDLCDVTVIIGNFRIMAHRIVLSASAPFFHQLFKSNHPHSVIHEYHIDDVDETAALKIIEFCYTSAISVDEDIVWQLLSASLKFECSEISGLCCEFLQSDLNISTCLRTHLLALKYKFTKLLAITQQFIEDNFEKVLKSPALSHLTSTELIDLLLSLNNAEFKDREILAVSKVWLECNTNNSRHVSLQLIEEFPKFSEELHEFLQVASEEGNLAAQDMSWTSNGDNPSASENSLKENEREGKDCDKHPKNDNVLHIDSKTEENPNIPAGVPLHICVSCGDAFDSPDLVLTHKQTCDESAQPITKPRHQLSRFSSRSDQSECENGETEIMNVQNVDSATEFNTGVQMLSNNKEKSSLVQNGKGCDLPDNFTNQCNKTFSEKSKSKDTPSNNQCNLLSNQSLDKLKDFDSMEDEDEINENNVKKTESYEIKGKGRENNDIKLRAATDEIGNGYLINSSSNSMTGNMNDTNNNDINDGITTGKNLFGDSEKSDTKQTDNMCNTDSLSTGKKNNGCDIASSSHFLQDGSPRFERSKLKYPLLKFKCQLCCRAFNDRKGLAKHWKLVHGIDHEGYTVEDGASNASYRKSLKNQNDFGGQNDLYGNKKAKLESPPCNDTSEIAKIADHKCHHQSVGGKTNGGEFTGEVSDIEASEFMNRYLQQYNEFTRWCLEQGPLFCQLCLHYHSKGSVCPKSEAALKDNASPKAGDDSEFSTDRAVSEADASIDVVGDGDDDDNDNVAPLDMSKNSQDFSQSSHSNFSTSQFTSPKLVAPTPLDLSKYYSNYAQLMTAAVAGADVGQYKMSYPDSHSQLKSVDFSNESMYNSYLRYTPSSSYPLNLAQDNLSHGKSKTGVAHSSSLPGLGAVPQVQNKHGANGAVTSVGQSSQKKKSPSRQGFPCTVCNRVFSYQAALFTHMRTHSPSARTYQCQLCNQSFARAPDLKVHICPNGIEKPYVCPSCGQTFAKNIHLKRHLATHSGLKPYPCWVCGKRFSRSDHLKRHTQSIHAGSRPHGCQFCGKEFVRKYELNKHMLTHTAEASNSSASTSVNQEVASDVPLQ